jgi:hypothetical protein
VRRPALGSESETDLALASDGDVFNATGTAAVCAGLGNRAGYLFRLDPSVRRCFREIPRMAIGVGGMCTTFVAPRQALVDAISVGLVGNDENAAVRPSRRAGKEANTGQ